MKRLLAALIMLGALAIIYIKPSPLEPAPLPVITATIHTESGRIIPLKLEAASTFITRASGLMHRKTLAPYDGMAFFFPREDQQGFWMKNTLIPLDIIFVNKSGTIIYIVTAEPLSEKRVGPKEPTMTVIEIAGGRASREGIKPGDQVHYETPIAENTD